MFTSHRAANGLIYTYDRETGDVKRLTNQWEDNLREVRVTSSQTGYPVYYSTTRFGSYQIWSMFEENSPPEQITTVKAPYRDVVPDVSPDGSKVVFFSNRNNNDDIWLYEVETRKLTSITDEPSNESYPTFSPDGMKIAFLTDRNGSSDIWIMNADGS